MSSIQEFQQIYRKSMKCDEGEAHVWRINTNQPKEREEEFYSYLSEHEKEKASQFLRGRYRKKFISSHGAIKKILSLYLEKPPNDIGISYEKLGSPRILSSNIWVNWSHSGDLALLVLSSGQVGIDVEQEREIINADLFARCFLSESELSALRTVGQDEVHENLLRYWTVKEAAVKALGLGHRYPIKKIETFMFPNMSEGSITFGDNVYENAYFTHFYPVFGYYASLVSMSQDQKIFFYQYS
jgi:4'-phosphopantetheinyl transferase